MAQKHRVECLHENDWGALWEIIKAHTIHVTEGDKSGGFRDRLLVIEREVRELRNRFWLSAVIGGIIGGLVGSGSKDVLAMFIGWLMGR